jgi:hypothetical protein
MDTTTYGQFARLLSEESWDGARENHEAKEAGSYVRAKAAVRGVFPKQDPRNGAFLEAHDAVCRLEAAFGDAEPRLALSLVALDAAYQCARSDLRARKKEAPAVRSLTGDVVEYDAVQAIDELCASLTSHGDARWAKRHLEGPLGKLRPEILRAIARVPAAHDLREARAARAGVFGLASARSTTLLARRDPTGAAGLLMRRLASSTDWTQSVVKVWCDDMGTQGSGVFIRSNLVVTAAHVIAIRGAPDASHVHIEIPARGSSRLTATRLPYVGETVAEDYALIEVPRVDVPAMIVKGDFNPPDNYEVSRWGYPIDGGPRGAVGHISRHGDLFYTTDLHLPGGVSGGAVAAAFADGVKLVGIGTTDEPGATDEWFMGIPLPANLGSSGLER